MRESAALLSTFCCCSKPVSLAGQWSPLGNDDNDAYLPFLTLLLIVQGFAVGGILSTQYTRVNLRYDAIGNLKAHPATIASMLEECWRMGAWKMDN